MPRMQAGERRRAPGVQALRAYTRIVVTWTRRLTSLAMVVALSASPAMLSACMAMCAEAPPMTAMAHDHNAPMDEAVPAPLVAGHSHHSAPTTSAVGEALTLAPTTSTTHVAATCTNCFPDGIAVVAGPGVEREDAYASAAVTIPVARFLLPTAIVGAAPHGAPVSPPAPPLTPLVLRV